MTSLIAGAGAVVAIGPPWAPAKSGLVATRRDQGEAQRRRAVAFWTAGRRRIREREQGRDEELEGIAHRHLIAAGRRGAGYREDSAGGHRYAIDVFCGISARPSPGNVRRTGDGDASCRCFGRELQLGLCPEQPAELDAAQ